MRPNPRQVAEEQRKAHEIAETANLGEAELTRMALRQKKAESGEHRP
jgi:hypothetical protein